MAVIQMSAHARKASIARVEQMQKAEVARLANEAEAKARCDENDSQRRIHMRGLTAAIETSWVAPTMGPEYTMQAMIDICTRLGARPEHMKNFRDTLELLTAGKE